MACDFVAGCLGGELLGGVCFGKKWRLSFFLQKEGYRVVIRRLRNRLFIKQYANVTEDCGYFRMALEYPFNDKVMFEGPLNLYLSILNRTEDKFLQNGMCSDKTNSADFENPPEALNSLGKTQSYDQVSWK